MNSSATPVPEARGWTLRDHTFRDSLLSHSGHLIPNLHPPQPKPNTARRPYDLCPICPTAPAPDAARNRRAEDLWGLRPEEALGRHLLNLDVGLAFDQVRPLIRAGLSGDHSNGEVYRTEAVNRRGRTIGVQVRCEPLATDGETPGVIILIDED